METLATQTGAVANNYLVNSTARENLSCSELVQEKSREISLRPLFPGGRLIWWPPLGNQAHGSRPSSAPCARLPGSVPGCLCTTPNFALHFFFFFCNQQVADCPTVLSFIVNGCKKKKKKRKREKERKRKKIPQCYNLVLSVNQTFPVMLIACVSLMYFILLKSFETLQLSSYRPLCGYH